MGKPGKKATNIFQNPGIKNNNGVVLPKIKGVGSPLKDKGEIRDASEILGDQPGYNPNTNTVMQSGTAGAPMGSKAGLKLMGKAMAAATATTAPVIASGVIPKVLDKWNTFVDKKVKPLFKKNK